MAIFPVCRNLPGPFDILILRIFPQVWHQTDKMELVLGKLVCLDSSNKFREAKVKKCHELGGDQEWKIGDEGQNSGDGGKSTAIYNSAAGESF